MDRFLYKGNKTNVISFPLGGIGTGSIGLSGEGRLIDWEIFNRPSKNSTNGFSHFAIKAESGGKVLDARVLNGDLHPPYIGGLGGGGLQGGFGSGPNRDLMTGMPHFKETEFRGEFPLAEVDFKGTTFPGRVRMKAFNPFIPLNDKDSGLPAAFFEIEVKNTTRKPITYTLAGTLKNPFEGGSLNRFSKSGKFNVMHLKSSKLAEDDVKYGDLALATDATDVSYQEYWFLGGWFDTLEVYWRDLIAPGRFKNRTVAPDKVGGGQHALLAAHVKVKPGETKSVRFILSWYVPNCEAFWDGQAAERAKNAGVSPTWKNYYATLASDSVDVATYGLKHWDRLYGETKLFKDALFASDIPPAAMDAVSATMSVLKTATVLRLEDGTFYGWEGQCETCGCCEGSCTHVWNYTQALPFLFPKLERSMRDADFKYNQRPDGGMIFRIKLPLGSGQGTFRPCGDGHFGSVLKAYRDWKICGDDDWLRTLWPALKKSIEFAWAPTNEDKWDPDKTGVLQGRQHHTLDVEIFGPNAWMTGFYLAALKAAAEMADYLGEPDTAAEYRALFEKGKGWADKHLFNGEYYHQAVDLKDKSVLDPYGDAGYYWNEEHGELKYQIGEGCEIDQVLAQWHANLYGLGEVFDLKQVKTALKSLFKHNFVKSFREYYNPCRIYALNDEAGLAIAHWPEGKYKPMVPLPYSQETQNGYEYAACIQMIQAGLVKEGMTCVEAIRDRYDGEKRNPWNEFECGSNYARSMAAYSLLNTFSRFQFNMPKSFVGFDPIQPKNGRFKCFWSLDSGWGTFEMAPNAVRLTVLQGSLTLKTLDLPFLKNKSVTNAAVGRKKLQLSNDAGALTFAAKATVKPGAPLVIRVGKKKAKR